MTSSEYKVVGVTFEGRQRILSDFYKTYAYGKKYGVILQHEPTNEYDKNAISILLEVNKDDYKKVGYISKNDNVGLVGKLDKVKTASLLSIGVNAKSEIGLSISVTFEE